MSALRGIASDQSQEIETSRTAAAAKRLRKMYMRLVETYGPQQWWPAKTPLEVIVGAYLTQSTAWRSVERSIANLEAVDVLSIDGLRAISEIELRELIRPSGFVVRKAASIKSFIAFLDENYSGSLDKLAAEPVETTRERLLTLQGIGPETADAILLYALGQAAMVVDEYLRRVVTRHDLLPEKARYAEIQRLAVRAFDDDSANERSQHFNEFHALIVEVGKRHCRRVAKCEACPLAFDLPNMHEAERGAAKLAETAGSRA